MKRKIILPVIFGIFTMFSLFAIQGAYAMDLTHSDIFFNPEPAQHQFFGTQVAVSGNNIVIANPTDDTGVTAPGTIYMYQASTGAMSNSISNPTFNLSFSNSIFLEDDRVLVGAPKAGIDVENGGVFLYNVDSTMGFSTGIDGQDADSTLQDDFGSSVGLSGNNIIIGDPNLNAYGIIEPAAYLYDATGNFQHSLSDPNSGSDDRFGSAVAIDGNVAIVGSPGVDEVHQYSVSSGNFVRTFSSPLGSNTDYGGDVDIDGNLIIIGDKDGAGTFKGIAFLYDATTGNLLHTLSDPEPSTGIDYGRFVAVSGNYAVVSDPLEGEFNAGKVHVFDTATGNHLAELLNPDIDSQDLFGFAVDIDGDLVVVGARGDDNSGFTSNGAAYLYDLSNLPEPVCTPPVSGDWIISSTCTMESSATVTGNVIIPDGVVLTILDNVTLDINFATQNLTVESGGGVLIKAGGAIT